MELEECLIDKSTNSFTSAPEFAELVAIVQKFHELLSLTPFTHFDLEMALQEENNQPQKTTMDGEEGQKPERKRSRLIENLLTEILEFFSVKFESSNLCRKLYTLVGNINGWCIPQFDVRLMLPRKRSEEMETKMEENGNEKQNLKRKSGLEEEEENVDEEKRMKEMDQEIGSQENNDDELEGRSHREESSNESSQSQASSRSTNQNGRESSVTESSGGRRLYGIALYHKMNVPDYLNMTTEEKLHFLCFLVNAQLECAEDSGDLDKEFMAEQQRLLPLAIDPDGRKFWYFSGDTWLFMEEGRLMDAEEEERMAEEKMKKKKAKEEEIQKAEKKTKNGKVDKNTKKNGKGGKAKKAENKESERKKNKKITQKQLDETYFGLFTGHRLRVVCKSADHFTALIAAYKSQQKNADESSEFIEKLEQCAQQVKAIEEERLRKAAEQAKKSLSPARQSSRIAKMLENRRVVEEQRQRRHAAIMAERKRLEMDQEEFLREHRRLTDSEIQTPTMSREDRLKLRQQRIQEQLEREQLIEAGLLTPSPSTMAADEEEMMTNNELAETEEEEEERGNKEFGRKLGEKRRKIAIGEMMAASMMKRGKRSLMMIRENADKLVEYEQQEHAQMMGTSRDWWHAGEEKTAFASLSTSAPTATTSRDGSFISLFQRQSPYKSGLFNSNQNNNSNNRMATRKMPYRASAANHLCVSGGSGRSLGAGCDWVRNALKLTPNENEEEMMRTRFTFATRQPLASQIPTLPVVKKAKKEENSSSIGSSTINNNDNKFSKWAQVNPFNALKTSTSSAAMTIDISNTKSSPTAKMLNNVEKNGEEIMEEKLDETKSEQNCGKMDEQNNNSNKSPMPPQLPCPQIC